MTFRIPAEIDKFTWREVGGHPAATVEKWGHGYWIVCCPLCGYIHNISAAVKVGTTGAVYKPNCAIAKTVHRHMYHAWQDAHPRAAQFDAVTLILRNRQPIPLNSPSAAPEREIALIPAAKAA